jgi:glucan phosphorylase
MRPTSHCRPAYLSIKELNQYFADAEAIVMSSGSNLRGNLLLADYQAYVEEQERVSALWRKPQAWTRMSIPNTARMGKFSSDRSICDYCERGWKIEPGSRLP